MQWYLEFFNFEISFQNIKYFSVWLCDYLAQDGCTILSFACDRGHIQIVQLLLSAGATVNDKETKVLS